MKRLAAKALAVAALAAVFAGTADAAVTLIDGSTQGYYNAQLGDLHGVGLSSELFPGANCSTGDPSMLPNTAEPTWLGPNIGTWLGNFAPTGGGWSTGLVSIPAQWKVNDETAIVYVLDGGKAGLSNVEFDLGVDNGLFVWIDGIFKLGAMAPYGSNLGEYHLDLGSLSAGKHFVQILREDHGGSTDFDILAKGDVNPARVPEPGTMLLVGTGLLGMIGLGRKRVGRN
jgi:hypothetical protein